MEFQEFPKMGRWSREIIVTEKIDGTNAQIFITSGEPVDLHFAIWSDGDTALYAGSRTRWITPGNDNFGFAAWAQKNAEQLLELGPGRHFGEWWGQGIQRKYGLSEKRFSLFNRIRWCLHGETPLETPGLNPKDPPKVQSVLPECCGLVPVLYRGPMSEAEIYFVLDKLRTNGSQAAPGFMDPEGVVIYHVAAGVGFKKTLDGDGHKGAK